MSHPSNDSIKIMILSKDARSSILNTPIHALRTGNPISWTLPFAAHSFGCSLCEKKKTAPWGAVFSLLKQNP